MYKVLIFCLFKITYNIDINNITAPNLSAKPTLKCSDRNPSMRLPNGARPKIIKLNILNARPRKLSSTKFWIEFKIVNKVNDRPAWQKKININPNHKLWPAVKANIPNVYNNAPPIIKIK